MRAILSGEATPAQAAGFLLVGRAAGDSPPEMAAYARAAASFVREIDAPGKNIVTVAGGFDGKLRTLNVGAASSLVAAAAGAKVLMVGCEKTPPKEGRTVFEAFRGLGVSAPQPLDEAANSLQTRGFAATSTEHYLPELHALLGLRWEMARRTVLNVVEKLVSPIPGSARFGWSASRTALSSKASRELWWNSASSGLSSSRRWKAPTRLRSTKARRWFSSETAGPSHSTLIRSPWDSGVSCGPR